MLKHYSFFLVLCLTIQFTIAQSFKVHSHNDYLQEVPFWSAYANGVNSIEIDIFLKEGKLYVAHTESDIVLDRTLQSLYLKPIENMRSLQLGKGQPIQLLIDVKSEPYATLNQLVLDLELYPEIVNDISMTIVISGNRPKVQDYFNFPKYISFDYQSLEAPKNEKVWNKVALISLNFKNISSWNGKGRLTLKDYKNVKNTIDKAHSYNKPFRFWGAPDSKTAWKAFLDFGVDYINTDMLYASTSYLNTLEDRVYYNTEDSKVYEPSFTSDQQDTEVKNIILLIGDGNGLAQISSSMLANGGALTLTQFKSIGLLKTQSADDFTTDSAAAGTALAAGVKTNNRAIGVDSLGSPVKNLTELLHEKGFLSGVITTDEITGATPSAFYAHRTDRSDMDGIISDLYKSKISIVIGGGSSSVAKGLNEIGFVIAELSDEIKTSKEKRVAHFLSQKGVPSVLEGRGAVLAKATRNSLTFLDNKDKPFFLMIEGAQIDSYGHHNNVPGIVSEGIDFDRAITEAVKFADAKGNTLVIVTADHETSGFSIPQGNLQTGMIEGDFTTEDHTAVMVPIFAYGPKSDEFQGVYDNFSVFNKMIEVLNVKD
jgi:alkaline phosphatase